ncbi:MAG: hypothetical protein M3441_26320, partial [Chloroflexota bacterium]|nr:hypothetical protein [Chloroflexota bacterium]
LLAAAAPTSDYAQTVDCYSLYSAIFPTDRFTFRRTKRSSILLSFNLSFSTATNYYLNPQTRCQQIQLRRTPRNLIHITG